MRLICYLALSFLCKKNSKRPNFISLISLLGVAFGVAAFLVVVTVTTSIETELRRVIFAANPNLMIFANAGIPNALEVEQDLLKRIDKPLEGSSPFVYAEGVLASEADSTVAFIRGIEGKTSWVTKQLSSHITPSSALDMFWQEGAEPKIILGKTLASKLKVGVGDFVTLMNYTASQEDNKPFYQKLLVAGTIDFGLAQYDAHYAMINFRDAVTLFLAPGWASGIEFKFINPDDSLAVAQKLRKEIIYNVHAWQEIDAPLFQTIERDSKAIELVVFIICLVACFNILVTLSLTVIDKRKEIALLRSLGATKSFIIGIFIVCAGIIGFFGSLLGILLGLGILKIFAGLPLKDLQEFYFLEAIPVHFDLQFTLITALIAIFMALLGALYPAIKASRIMPVQGLKI